MSSADPTHDDDAAPDHELPSESKLQRELTLNRLSSGMAGVLLATLSLGAIPCVMALLGVLYELIKEPSFVNIALLVVLTPLLMLCVLALWLSWRSIQIHRHQSARSNTQLQTLRQRRQAQGGSMSLAQEAQERGAIAITSHTAQGALSDAAESTRFDFDETDASAASQDTEAEQGVDSHVKGRY